MRLAALSGLTALVMLMMAFRLDDPAAQGLIRLGAFLQILHALAVIACPVFMAVGGRAARFAPAPFLLGSAMFSGALYARAVSVWDGGDLALGLGAALMAAGWGVLAVAAGGVDRGPGQ